MPQDPEPPDIDNIRCLIKAKIVIVSLCQFLIDSSCLLLFDSRTYHSVAGKVTQTLYKNFCEPNEKCLETKFMFGNVLLWRQHRFLPLGILNVTLLKAKVNKDPGVFVFRYLDLCNMNNEEQG